MASHDTVFTNDTGAAGGTSAYVQDALPDFTFPASNNTGLTSNANTNPMGLSFANTDLTQFGAKYLAIKDLVLIQDRSKWISNKPTYQVIFYQSFPQINCYVFGNIQITQQNQTSQQNSKAAVQFKTIGDGISVNGVVRRVAFVVQPSTAATATAQVVVDGVNGNTIDFSGLTSAAPSPEVENQFSAFVHSSSNESYGLHDIRLTALQASTLIVNGVIVYFENSGANIDQLPGTTYVNKTKVLTTAGSTFSIPSMGSSLGGKAFVYKNTLSGYTVGTISCTTIASLGSGSSGTNLLTVTTGQGASFAAGYGLVMTQGSSSYVGSVVSVSTDTLTMGNTLGFGTSTTAAVYTAWKAGSTLSINASLMSLAYSIDFSKFNQLSGFSNSLFDPSGNYAFWGNNIGLTFIDSVPAAVFLGASGFMQTDGYFSAAEFELIGNAIFSATLSVNGMPSWSANAGQTGAIRKTVFTDAGPGWNSFNIGVGASMGAIGLRKINLYHRRRDIGISFGVLSEFDVCQTYTDRGAVNASMMALGGLRRTYADQLYLKGPWVRSQVPTAPGGVQYIGSSTNSALSFQYYGKNFAVVGTAGGGTLTLDGAGVPLTFNAMQTASSETWHTVSYTVGSGATATIQAVDFVRSNEKFNTVTTVAPSSIGSTQIPTLTRTAFSVSSGSFSTGSGSLTDVTGLSVTITANGTQEFEIGLTSDDTSNLSAIGFDTGGVAGQGSAQFAILEDGSSISVFKVRSGVVANTAHVVPPGLIRYIKTPSAGSHTYKLQTSLASDNVQGADALVQNCKLFVRPLPMIT